MIQIEWHPQHLPLTEFRPLSLPAFLIFGDGRIIAIVMPPIPLEPFRLCVFARDRPIEIGYTCISLFFGETTHLRQVRLQSLTHFQDLAAFAVIIGFGLKSGLNATVVSISRPTIVKTIVQDATIYFFIIFTSHLVFVVTLVFARVSNRRN